MSRAVRLIESDAFEPGEIRDDGRSSGANLVWNLAEWLRELDVEPRLAVLGINAIGGAVRDQFAGRELQSSSELTARILAGALAMGLTLADRDFDWRVAPPATPTPWNISYPVLLDPTLWMLLVAYELAGR